MLIHLHVKYYYYSLSNFNQTGIFYTKFLKNFQTHKFKKIRQVVAELVHLKHCATAVPSNILKLPLNPRKNSMRAIAVIQTHVLIQRIVLVTLLVE
jgi:hypothetical protein